MAGRSVGLLVRLGLEDTDFARRMQGASRRLDDFANRTQRMARRMDRLGTTLTHKVSYPIAALAFGAVKSFADFDKAMNESLAIMDNVQPRMRRQMEKTAKSISEKTTFSAAQAADGYYFLASAGLNAVQSIKALPAVAKFAQAGAFGLAEATEYAGDTQTALGLRSKNAAENLKNLTRVTDVLTHAANLSNASVEQFAEAMTNKAAASLRIVHKPIEEGTAVLAAFADQGLKGAGAGEALNIVLRDLQTAARKNGKEFKENNVAVFDANGKMRNMADIVGDLEQALKGMSDKQQGATLSALGFQDRSVSYIKSLLGMSGAIRGYERDLESAGGVTERVAGKQMETFSNRMLVMRNRLQNVGIEVGAKLAPSIERLGGFVIKLATGFSNMSPATQDMILKFALLAAGMGPVLRLAANLLSVISAIARHPLAAFIIGVGIAASALVVALRNQNDELSLTERYAQGAAGALTALKHIQDEIKGIKAERKDAELGVEETKVAMLQSRLYVEQLKKEGATKLDIRAATASAERAERNWLLAKGVLGSVLNRQQVAEGRASQESATAFSAAQAAKAAAARTAAHRIATDYWALVRKWGAGTALMRRDFETDILQRLQAGEFKIADVANALDSLPRQVRTEVTIAVGWQIAASNMSSIVDAIVNLPGKAAGGPVRRGQPYIVGERRPEVFIPDSNGRIIPRVQAPGGSGVTVIVNVDNRGSINGDHAATMFGERVATMIERKLRNAQSRQMAPLLGG